MFYKKVFGGTEPFFEKGSEVKSFWEGVVGGTLFSKRVPLTKRKFLGSLKPFFLKRVSGKEVIKKGFL
ncbi:MAG: hypothetical protein D6805_10330 [Planctomycetota bacterium]|nr:MAG: hypothetical protein D6805_10330 [Planctomycetota bacterium]